MTLILLQIVKIEILITRSLSLYIYHYTVASVSVEILTVDNCILDLIKKNAHLTKKQIFILFICLHE